MRDSPPQKKNNGKTVEQRHREEREWEMGRVQEQKAHVRYYQCYSLHLMRFSGKWTALISDTRVSGNGNTARKGCKIKTLNLS